MNSPTVDESLPPEIDGFGQQHLLQFWSELSPSERIDFANQLRSVDWNQVCTFIAEFANTQHQREDERIAPPAHVVRWPKTDADLVAWKRARSLGEDALRSGRVAAILLAGGQGTRLGFPHSKGMFPIGPVSQKSLFQTLAEQILAMSTRYGHAIPYLIMTSGGTHDETVEFFELHSYFGLDCKNVFFFQQGYAPSLSAETGRLLLAGKGELSMNPDGHGGLLSALRNAGLFTEMLSRGVEYLFSYQIDNPLVKACDPAFIGLHIQHQAEVSTKVVAKLNAQEKVGVAVDLNGRTAIIEYIDLPTELANQLDADGELLYWAGSTAIHVFNREFLERIASSAASLPWHRAIKKIPHINNDGQLVHPEKENGVKFERFLFDTLPMAKTALIVETIRDEEFAPLKNSMGDFSADYVRERMVRVAVNWLKSAQIAVPENAIVEISPLYAMFAEDLAKRSGELVNIQFDVPVYLALLDTPPMSSQLLSAMPTHVEATSAVIDPLVFDSFCRPQVWGGRGLATALGRRLPQDGPYGEAWDLSPQPLHVSRVTEGPLKGTDLNDLWTTHREEIAARTGPENFPLLIKWLECHELLSLQVHPDDAMAQRVLNEPYGKSEAWIVISAEPTARVYAGLKPGITREDVEAHLKDGTLADCLHSYTPKVGDCISLPAGTIHAAGGGLMIAEVQQSSDATFRMFDWNRLGLDGKPRALQIERALEATDWNQGPVSPVIPTVLPSQQPGVRGEMLVEGIAFRLERYTINHSMQSPFTGELTMWMVLEGKSEIRSPSTDFRRKFIKGETVMVPASANEVVWESRDDNQPLTLLCIHLQDSLV